eukprot:835420-Pleurochrysis_carterae.AAC.2
MAHTNRRQHVANSTSYTAHVLSCKRSAATLCKEKRPRRKRRRARATLAQMKERARSTLVRVNLRVAT